MQVPQKVKKLIVASLLLILGTGIGVVGCFYYVVEHVMKDEIFPREADQSIETLVALRMGDPVTVSSLAEKKLLDHLHVMKRPFLGLAKGNIEIESLSKKRIAAFQRAKEYYDHYGWDPDRTDPMYRSMRAFLAEVPWSKDRQELNEWNAKFKGPVPQQAPAISPVEWMDESVTPPILQGKVVLLDFWGMRCQRCLASFPELQKLYDSHRDSGLQVVAVHTQEPENERVPDFIQSAGYSFPVCFGQRPLAKKYMVPSLPCYFLIDRKGKLIWGPGHTLPSEAYLVEVLEETVVTETDEVL